MLLLVPAVIALAPIPHARAAQDSIEDRISRAQLLIDASKELSAYGREKADVLSFNNVTPDKACSLIPDTESYKVNFYQRVGILQWMTEERYHEARQAAGLEGEKGAIPGAPTSIGGISLKGSWSDFQTEAQKTTNYYQYDLKTFTIQDIELSIIRPLAADAYKHCLDQVYKVRFGLQAGLPAKDHSGNVIAYPWSSTILIDAAFFATGDKPLDANITALGDPEDPKALLPYVRDDAHLNARKRDYTYRPPKEGPVNWAASFFVIRDVDQKLTVKIIVPKFAGLPDTGTGTDLGNRAWVIVPPRPRIYANLPSDPVTAADIQRNGVKGNANDNWSFDNVKPDPGFKLTECSFSSSDNTVHGQLFSLTDDLCTIQLKANYDGAEHTYYIRRKQRKDPNWVDVTALCREDGCPPVDVLQPLCAKAGPICPAPSKGTGDALKRPSP
jgi:hypothetical protein